MIEYRQASEVKPREVPLLWRRRFPLGALSLVAGRPGSGKSTLTVFAAAELAEQGFVSLLSNPEDDLESVVRPRLDAARANLGLVYVVGEEADYRLPENIVELEDVIREVEASLVVLDPIAAHVPAVHSRSALRKLSALARRCRCAIVGVHHLTKNGSGLAAVGGSTGGLAGTARAVYAMEPYRRVDGDISALWCLKINGVERHGPLVFRRLSVETDGGVAAPELKVVWQGHGADPEVGAAAAEWLTLYLAAGEGCARLRGEVRADGFHAGFSWSLLQALRDTLEVDEFVRGRVAWWCLPADHPLR